MNRDKYSAIAHRDHVFSNPISTEKVNKLIDLIPLKPENKMIDIGAGSCELPIRFVETYDVTATAIERYDGAINRGKQRANGRIPMEKIDFIQADAKTVVEAFPEHHFDLGVCIGSTHAIGDFSSTIQALKKCVRKDGYILIGEGYWKQSPSPAYLHALGAEESDLKSHYENIQLGQSLGLIPLWSTTASEDDWDHYEWLYAMSIENYCFQNPEDPDCPEMLEKIRAWKQTYNKWGRDTLGFALYLFRN
ncbi:ubiquinone/menaquinone biosynthesis C-methylase UbiE [Cytobacillus eiseniae]|uniref:Ubiquinone/menaquinone biosynthesis C-methylase UbiE n=1 Tax=Cytobacillus eiseniae TaxID=762947 RepID=A0ABS4RKY8_9BACI|nr:class I SAM-dependent methyltransferase [Cytobacillus eiseniae]MBP2242969.1 ubiquinone/menaquinone biosynthesis C-methylase UbiE [Cytobacillus eiseniae]